MVRRRPVPRTPVHRQRVEALEALGFPSLADAERVLRLTRKANRPVRAVIDTDTFNEIDDQFALVYALRWPERLQVEAIYAAPFTNERAAQAAAGMESSRDEILRLLALMDVRADGLVFEGARDYVGASLRPQRSPAALDLVERAMDASEEDPLHVIGLAVPTNIVSALLIEPRIIRRIVVVWLGGHALHWPDTDEFNLRQDVPASRLLLDCGVPLILVPCNGVARLLDTTLAELERYVAPSGKLGAYLTACVRDYSADHLGWSKPLWDVGAIAAAAHEDWAPSDLVHSPVLTDDVTWSVDRSRHLIKCVRLVNRNKIMADLFRRIAQADEPGHPAID